MQHPERLTKDFVSSQATWPWVVASLLTNLMLQLPLACLYSSLPDREVFACEYEL
jgi:hypothetical protein